MRPLVLLWGCLVLPGYEALTGPKSIRAFEGDTVSLQCTYGEKLRDHKKYWCRKAGILITRCSGTIYAREDGQESTEGRLSIQDSPSKLQFNVTLRKLTPKDSGEYWCGVKILGFDEVFLVSLTVLPASPGVHPRVTTAKQGKTEAEASRFTGTSPPTHPGTPLYTGTSPYSGTSPREETSPHKATSPHAGTTRPSTHLDPTSAKDTYMLPSSSGSKSRVCPKTIRILAPVLVLLALLLVSGLSALGRYLFQWRKKAQLAVGTPRNEKAHYSHLPPGKGQVPEYTVINVVEAPAGPAASPKPSTSPFAQIRCLSQASEQEEASFQDPEGKASPGPPLHMSEEFRRSVFISV
ncbi:CMRF35-like molecule 9 isoform X2 [Pteronotus mesoamericanus]|uniref:CMRF35-like molecule 9 isoform X2 n=1 Tax=Pteronotus mesoamericanus TaxID=1884717 RepID=UPI0023EB4F4B|nr:CMRF35-like molecule 9 isoform X2 [Pteronotus parnellii mesoamericanus]